MGEDRFDWIKPTITSEHQKAVFYQMKVDSRVEGPFDDTMDLTTNVKTTYLSCAHGPRASDSGLSSS